MRWHEGWVPQGDAATAMTVEVVAWHRQSAADIGGGAPGAFGAGWMNRRWRRFVRDSRKRIEHDSVVLEGEAA